MRDVAAAAGVSVMTVSRVLNGAGAVAAETAARVEQAIAELGYRRNDIARHLRQKGQVSRTIGLVVDDLGNPFYSALARAVEDAAYRRGYLVLVGSTNDDPYRERELVSAFSARQVDGLIVVPTSGNQGFLSTQLAMGTPIVCADRTAKGLDVDTVTVNNRDAAMRAVAHLLDHGHRRIAYLGDQRSIWTLKERYAGYRVPLADKLSPPVTVVSQDPATIGATAAQLLFSRIDGNEGPPRWVMLLTRFVARGSGEIRAPRERLTAS